MSQQKIAFFNKVNQRKSMFIHFKVKQILKCYQQIILKEHQQYQRFKHKKSFIPNIHIASFKKLSIKQKMDYYLSIINLIQQNFHQHLPIIILEGKYTGTVFIRSQKLTLKRWKQKKIILLLENSLLTIFQKQKSNFIYLKNYLIRKSKLKEKFCFVLEALVQAQKKKNNRIHIGLNSKPEYQKWFNIFNKCIINQRNNIILSYQNQQRSYQSFVSKQHILYVNLYEQLKENINQMNFEQQNKEQLNHQKQIIIQNLIENQQIKNLSKQKKFKDHCIQNKLQYNNNGIQSYKNIFNNILPNYQLQLLPNQSQYNLILASTNFKLMRHKIKINNFKAFIQTKVKSYLVFNFLSNPYNLTLYNSLVEKVQIKHFIKSQNTAIIYQKNQANSYFHMARDFLFLRHAFKKNNIKYIVDINIKQSTLPSFFTIIRGQIKHNIIGIYQQKQKNKIIIQLQMKNQGFLTEKQNSALIIDYMKQFMKLNSIFNMNQHFQLQLFNLKWQLHQQQIMLLNQFIWKQNKYIQVQKNFVIQPKEQTETSSLQNLNVLLEQQKKINMSQYQNNEIQNVLQQENDNTLQNYNPQIDQSESIIINQEYLQQKHKTNVIQTKQKFMMTQNGHHIWKGQWQVDKQKGGLFYLNQKKIQKQKKILIFILKKIGINLLSRENILNISLPIDIFSNKSNLQSFAQSFRYAPKLLERVVKASPLEQFKICVILGITISLLSIDIQKHFDPILGETFQGWINGCPVYLQQISHHPPIAAFLMYGRGYKIYGCFQSKFNLSINSGTGYNQGQIIIQFLQSNRKFYFRGPGGLLTGLTFGIRKFNLVNRAYCYSKQSGLFCQLLFNQFKKRFFSKKKFSTDYFYGKLFQVEPEFIQEFRTKKIDAPNPVQIKSQIGLFQGKWTKNVYFNGYCLIDFDKQIGFNMQYEKYPLASNSYYREDLVFRIFNEMTKSQKHKQKLQIIQRNDCKLRMKLKKKI